MKPFLTAIAFLYLALGTRAQMQIFGDSLICPGDFSELQIGSVQQYYEAPDGQTECYNSNDIYIEYVEFNTYLNQLSGCNGTSGIYDDESQIITTVAPGGDYQLRLEPNISSNLAYAVWIDFNQNGVFEEAEAVYLSTSMEPFVSTTVSIPSSAVPGVTKMRIRAIDFMLYSASDASSYISSSDGEASDYNILIDGPFTYEWSSSPLGFNSTDRSISVSPSTTTEYLLDVTNTNNGSSYSASYTVNVNEGNYVLNASDDATICGSFRGAINYSNSNPGRDTIIFHSAMVDSTIDWLGGEMMITEDVVILGAPNYPLPRIDAQNMSSFFSVDEGVDLTIQGLFFLNAQVYRQSADLIHGSVFSFEGNSNALFDNCYFENNYGDDGVITTRQPANFEFHRGSFYDNESYIGNGGGINMPSGGRLVMDGTSFYRVNSSGYGGAVNFIGEGLVALNNTNFSRCTSGASGGGVNIQGNGTDITNVQLSQNSFSTNTAQEYGGGLHINFINSLSSTFDRFYSNVSVRGSGAGVGVYDVESGVFESVYLSGNSSGLEGGGMYLTQGSFYLNDSYFDNNDAVLHGGAIYLGNGCDLNIDSTRFNDNFSEYAGGALYTGTLSNSFIYKSTFQNNLAVEKADFDSLGYGGAVFAEGSTSFASSSFLNNSAKYGGAIYYNTLNIDTISNSTFINNGNFQGANIVMGGAIYNGDVSDLHLYNNTFYNELSDPQGTGADGSLLFIDGNGLLGSNIFHDEANYNSIALGDFGNITSLGSNYFRYSDNLLFPFLATDKGYTTDDDVDIIFKAPKIIDGITTVLPYECNTIIEDAGENFLDLQYDQSDLTRNVGDALDIGAYENQYTEDGRIRVTNTFEDTLCGSFASAILLANANPGLDTIYIDLALGSNHMNVYYQFPTITESVVISKDPKQMFYIYGDYSLYDPLIDVHIEDGGYFEMDGFVFNEFDSYPVGISKCAEVNIHNNSFGLFDRWPGVDVAVYSNGVLVDSTNNLVIENNTFSGAGNVAVSVSNTNEGSISYNRFGYGIYDSLQLSNGGDISISNSRDITIAFNHIGWTWGTSIEVLDGSKNVSISENFIGTHDAIPDTVWVEGVGIGIYESSNSSITNNYLLSTEVAIEALYSDSITICNNKIGISAYDESEVAASNVGISVDGINNIICENVITNVEFDAIRISNDLQNSYGNTITQNRLYCNGSGVSLLNGANNNIFPPAVYEVQSGKITGIASTGDNGNLNNATVEIFVSDTLCDVAEGMIYIGSTDVNNGLWEFTGNIDGGISVIALLTDSAGNSSQYSNMARSVDCGVFELNLEDTISVCTDTAIVTLENRGFDNIFWIHEDDIDGDATSEEITLITARSGKYLVIADSLVDGGICSLRDSFYLNILNLDVVLPNAGPDIYTCEDSVNLVATNSNAFGAEYWEITRTGISSLIVNDSTMRLTGLEESDTILATWNFDYGSCVVKDTSIIYKSRPFEVVDNVTDVSCKGNADGSIKLSFTNGAPPYRILPQDFGLNDTLTDNLSADDYYYVVEDATGCTVSGFSQVSEPDSIAWEYNITDSYCYTHQRGSIEIVNVAGGDGGYEYFIFTSDSIFLNEENRADSLFGGVYYVDVVDENGCYSVDSIFIENDSTLPTTKIEVIGADDQVFIIKELGSSLWVEDVAVNYTDFNSGQIVGAYSNDTINKELIINRDTTINGFLNVSYGIKNYCDLVFRDSIIQRVSQAERDRRIYIEIRGDQLVVTVPFDSIAPLLGINVNNIALLAPVEGITDNEQVYYIDNNARTLTIEINEKPTDLIYLDGLTLDVTVIEDNTAITKTFATLVRLRLDISEFIDEPGLGLVYNAISPDLEDGIHDYLEIENLDLYPENTLTIFNKWGDRVFKVEGYNSNQLWDGITDDGKKLPSGTYYYSIEFVRMDGDKDAKQGFIELRR